MAGFHALLEMGRKVSEMPNQGKLALGPDVSIPELLALLVVLVVLLRFAA